MSTPARRKARLWLSAVGAILALIAMVGLLAYRSSTTQKFKQQSYENCKGLNTLRMTFRLFIREILKPQPGETVTSKEQAAIDRIERITQRRFKPTECVSS